MKCPKCGGKTYHSDTVKTPDKCYRRRSCNTCGNLFYTMETAIDFTAEFWDEWSKYHRGHLAYEQSKLEGKKCDV